MTLPLASRPTLGSPAWIDDYGLSSRAACRRAQLEIARTDPRVFSLEGDLAYPAVPFHEEYPDRFLQIGISEADLVATAAGLAQGGKVPFVNSFASFLSFRALEQVRLDVAYHRANVKLIGYYCGLSGGYAGPTHACIEDLAVLRSLPGLTVLSPADTVATYQATWAAAEWDGPVYIRVGRAENPQVYDREVPFRIGRAVRLVDGDDLTLVATGNQMVHEALEARRALAEEGVSCRVLDMHTIKPLDREAVTAAAEETGAVVTVEDHNVLGGLGSAVAEVLLSTRPVPLVRVGVPDTYCEEVAPHEEMLRTYGLDSAGIARAARRALDLREARR